MPWDVFSARGHGGHTKAPKFKPFSFLKTSPRPQQGKLSLLRSDPRIPVTRSWEDQLLPYLSWALRNPETLLSSSTSSSTANYTLDFQTSLPSLAGTSAPACAFPGSADPVQRASPNSGLPMGTWLGVHSIVDSFHNIKLPEGKKPPCFTCQNQTKYSQYYSCSVKAILTGGEGSQICMQCSNPQDT